MRTLRIIAVGRSAGIELPKAVLARLKVNKGDAIQLIETANGYEIVRFDGEFDEQMRIAARGMRKYRTALRTLARS